MRRLSACEGRLRGVGDDRYMKRQECVHRLAMVGVPRRHSRRCPLRLG